MTRGHRAYKALEARGYEVHAVARRVPPTDSGVRWHSGDLLDRRQAERLVGAVAPSHLLHLAWYAEPGLYWESPENDRWRRASVDLLRAFAAAGGRRAVVAGTCAEYDWAAETEAMSERRTPLAPRGAYGAAKDALRRDLERWSAETGSSSAWARLFFLFGPAEDPRRLVPSVARALLSGRPAETSTGRQVRDFLLSSEAAGAMAALLDSEVTGPVNVGSGSGVSVRCLVELVGEAVGRPELLRLGALPDRPDEPPRVVADATRLQHEVGWRPSGDVAAWVEETVGWWRRRLAG
jgi:nucleoside-diphosphate-sugar epimerase